MMIKKTCFITGGNSGIGKQAAIQLAQSGFHVVIGVRNLIRGEAALAEIKSRSGKSAIELLQIDMSSKKSIIHATDELKSKNQKLDVLIHNAADFDITRKQAVQSVEGIESVWVTNHIGPVLLTNLLMDLLKNSEQGRVITIASQGLVVYPGLTIDLQDPEFKRRKFSVSKAYYQSKLAQVMYTYWLAEQLKDTAITVNCIRVTNVKLDINRYATSRFLRFMYSIKSRFSILPEEMAKTYLHLATSTDITTTTGTYFNEKNQAVSSSPYSMKQENIDAVMALTMTYIE
ncbi:SDR family NAD(P)-dependent oxidoreductase [Candidatus Haliotispira prima]|uniref:SDR family NAD(P)-dependent oxidoreductase n=1 Tax=Candidatus Haliotispira prima TaxID=3034016 RepID=A0ABY8MHF4_9SPIO|nr:SDR family NAD(P)-dependent oxidoreductase [Candidatus Haliotispira prima]